MNRNSAPFVKVYPNITLNNGGVVRRAIVWGDPSHVVAESQLIKMWKAKPRKTPLAVMLAKASAESSYKPYIARYEIGQEKDNPNWKFKNEYDSTSYGLFQIMGFNLSGKWAIADKSNPFASFSIEKQLDYFDEFFSSLMATARRKFPHYTDDQIVYSSLGAYGGGDYTPDSGSALFELVNRAYRVYVEKKKL